MQPRGIKTSALTQPNVNFGQISQAFDQVTACTFSWQQFGIIFYFRSQCRQLFFFWSAALKMLKKTTVSYLKKKKKKKSLDY